MLSMVGAPSASADHPWGRFGEHVSNDSGWSVERNLNDVSGDQTIINCEMDALNRCEEKVGG
jgi:hypothetical protein